MVHEDRPKYEMEVELEDEEDNEDEAPEGGWGWVVAFGLALVLIVTLGPMACFGLIFGNFLEGLGEGSRGVTLINSVYMALHSFSGLFTNYALKSYSCRQVALVGSLLFFVGNLATSFATNIFHMIITFGILPGVGLGLMIPASFHCFNDYFIRRRVFVMGIAQTTLSAGSMLYPIIVEHLVEKFGFRGAQAIVAAMTLGATLGALSFIPAVRKSKKLNTIVSNKVTQKVNGDFVPKNLSCGEKVGSAQSIPKDGEKPISEQDAKYNRESVKLMCTLEPDYDHESDHTEDKQQIEKKTENALTVDWKPREDQTSPLIMENGRKHSQVRNGSLVGDDSVQQLDLPNGMRHLSPRLSIISTGSLVVAGADSLALSSRRLRGSRRNIWSTIVDFLDLGLLKDPVYTNLALGVSCAYYSDFTFITLFPLFMFSLGFTMSETALCIAVGAACDLAGRIVFSMLGAWTSIRSRTVFLIGAICMVLGRVVMIYAHGYLILVIANGFHGFFRAWIHANFALVFAEHCHRDRFPSAYGLFMAISGVIGISTGPLVGVIRDVTNSYPICIHSLNVQMMLCIVPWILELTYTRFCRRKENDNAAP
ncbi:monocarboxylate transporter 7 isoform X2 [Anabrus simplex]